MGVDLSVDIGGLTIQNPIMTASGTFGYGEEFAPFVDLVELGGIIVKGISLEPRAGNAPSRIVETPSGMLNAIGLQNVGIDAFIEKKIPMLEQLGCVVFVNVLGDSIDDYAEIARRLDPYPSLHGLEINISCPNVKKGGVVFGSSPEMAGRVTEAVNRLWSSYPLMSPVCRIWPRPLNRQVQIQSVLLTRSLEWQLTAKPVNPS